MIRTLAAALATSTCILALASPAAAQTREYNIPAGSLKSALDAYVRQSGRQVVYRADQVRSARSPGTRGAQSEEAALAAILSGSGFTTRVDGNLVAIVKSSGNVQSVATDSSPSSGEPNQTSSEIVVTGSRLSQGSQDGLVAVTVLNQERIKQLGVTTVSQALDYIPQQTFSFNGVSTTGSREVRLRGLTSGTTLVLINGRRTVTSALTAGVGALDLSSIPLAAVDRIEILSESASAVYGADALAGVVNVIMKTAVDRPTFTAYFGDSTNGGAAERRVSFTGGVSSGGFKLVTSLDYFNQSALLGRQRSATANADYRSVGGRDLRSTVTNPGNICSTDGANLPGLNAPCAAVPSNPSSPARISDFVPTAGASNLGTTYRNYSIFPATERTSIVANTSYDISTAVELFAEGSYSYGRVKQRYGAPGISFGLVSADQAFNPFGVPVYVDYRIFGLDRNDVTKTDTLRGVVGAKGLIGSDTESGVQWELSVLGLRDESNGVQTGALNYVNIDRALSARDPSQALNVFVPGQGANASLLDGLTSDLVTVDNLSEALQFSGSLQSPIFKLPAGSVRGLVGVEQRREKLRFFLSTDTIEPSRESYAIFGEIYLPIVSPSMDVPGVTEISARIAARYDHYDDFGGTFNPQINVAWKPTPSLLLRGSYSTSFRAPTLVQLYRPALSFDFPFVDPARGEESALATLTFGGNRDLKPEEGRSSSIGLVWQPEQSKRTKIGLTYWRLTQTQTVRFLSHFAILANEGLFPELITRAPRTPSDVAAGLPGRLRGVNTSNVNFGEVELQGIDADVATRLPTPVGDITLSSSATWTLRYNIADTPGLAAASRVGRGSPEGSVPALRSTATVGWERQAISASASLRYNSGYRDYDIYLGAENGRRVPGMGILDFQVGWDIGSTFSSLFGTKLQVGLINAFDKRPPYSETGDSRYDPSTADIRGRFAYLSLSKAF